MAFNVNEIKNNLNVYIETSDGKIKEVMKLTDLLAWSEESLSEVRYMAVLPLKSLQSSVYPVLTNALHNLLPQLPGLQTLAVTSQYKTINLDEIKKKCPQLSTVYTIRSDSKDRKADFKLEGQLSVLPSGEIDQSVVSAINDKSGITKVEVVGNYGVDLKSKNSNSRTPDIDLQKRKKDVKEALNQLLEKVNNDTSLNEEKKAYYRNIIKLINNGLGIIGKDKFDDIERAIETFQYAVSLEAGFETLEEIVKIFPETMHAHKRFEEDYNVSISRIVEFARKIGSEHIDDNEKNIAKNKLLKSITNMLYNDDELPLVRDFGLGGTVDDRIMTVLGKNNKKMIAVVESISTLRYPQEAAEIKSYIKSFVQENTPKIVEEIKSKLDKTPSPDEFTDAIVKVLPNDFSREDKKRFVDEISEHVYEQWNFYDLSQNNIVNIQNLIINVIQNNSGSVDDQIKEILVKMDEQLIVDKDMLKIIKRMDRREAKMFAEMKKGNDRIVDAINQIDSGKLTVEEMAEAFCLAIEKTGLNKKQAEDMMETPFGKAIINLLTLNNEKVDALISNTENISISNNTTNNSTTNNTTNNNSTTNISNTIQNIMQTYLVCNMLSQSMNNNYLSLMGGGIPAVNIFNQNNTTSAISNILMMSMLGMGINQNIINLTGGTQNNININIEQYIILLKKILEIINQKDPEPKKNTKSTDTPTDTPIDTKKKPVKAPEKTKIEKYKKRSDEQLTKLAEPKVKRGLLNRIAKHPIRTALVLAGVGAVAGVGAAVIGSFSTVASVIGIGAKISALAPGAAIGAGIGAGAGMVGGGVFGAVATAFKGVRRERLYNKFQKKHQKASKYLSKVQAIQAEMDNQKQLKEDLRENLRNARTERERNKALKALAKKRKNIKKVQDKLNGKQAKYGKLVQKALNTKTKLNTLEAQTNKTTAMAGTLQYLKDKQAAKAAGKISEEELIDIETSVQEEISDLTGETVDIKRVSKKHKTFDREASDLIETIDEMKRNNSMKSILNDIRARHTVTKEEIVEVPQYDVADLDKMKRDVLADPTPENIETYNRVIAEYNTIQANIARKNGVPFVPRGMLGAPGPLPTGREKET